MRELCAGGETRGQAPQSRVSSGPRCLCQSQPCLDPRQRRRRKSQETRLDAAVNDAQTGCHDGLTPACHLLSPLLRRWPALRCERAFSSSSTSPTARRPARHPPALAAAALRTAHAVARASRVRPRRPRLVLSDDRPSLRSRTTGTSLQLYFLPINSLILFSLADALGLPDALATPLPALLALHDLLFPHAATTVLLLASALSQPKPSSAPPPHSPPDSHLWLPHLPPQPNHAVPLPFIRARWPRRPRRRRHRRAQTSEQPWPAHLHLHTHLRVLAPRPRSQAAGLQNERESKPGGAV